MHSRVYMYALLSMALQTCAGSQSKASLHETKTELFLSAPSFAVVGASDDETKFGTIVFKTMLEKGMDVVPINPFVSESQGIPCLHSLAEIADPAQTSISVVTQPAVSLQILQQATALGILAVWLQPGAEDDAVLEFIRNAGATGNSTTSFIHSVTPLPDVVRRDNGTGPQVPPCPRDGPETPDLISTLWRRN
ncbi:CoA-binding domain-containing protein [Mycena venus]|uniref:CoA-binding domain-containing protein n=1 Tax=Mycena venus TaxID=2733690 RepID=A0A8H6YTM1_9AGAR|nr:CoA-binding domain-containing protein [Mycena venus]